MRYSSRVGRLSGKGASAWEIHSAAVAAKRAGEDVVVLSLGDPDFSTPEMIVERAVEALRAGDTHYTDIPGRPALRAAIARDHYERGGANVTAGNVIVLSGAQNALFSAALCLFEPGDEVIVIEPIYVTYAATVAASGARIVPVPPRPDSGFRPDLEAVERAITPKTRAIMFANPNNPSGVVMSEAELKGIGDIARRHDLWVIADEVYAALTFDAPHIPMSGLPGMAERTVTISSLSKSQAMTGWRCGWLIGPEELTGHADRLSLCMLYGLPGFVQEAALVALTGARGEMDAMRQIYRRRRDLVHRALAQVPEIKAELPAAGMFLLIDVRRTGLSPSDFTWSLFNNEKVSLLDASAFGSSASGFVRLSYTLGEEELSEGCRRIKRFVEGLSERPARRASG
jgi:polar amino acid transport system ATP-binding protein/arginine:pyruvate transaminase